MAEREQAGPSIAFPPQTNRRTAHRPPFLLDNLPRIDHGIEPISVYWLGLGYDGKAGEFLTYPEEHWGLDTELLLAGDFRLQKPQEILVFLQSWLFFGLLKEALGDENKLDYRDWIADCDDPSVRFKTMMSPKLDLYLSMVKTRLGNPARNRPPWSYWAEVFGRTIAVAEAFDMRFAMVCSEEEVEQSLPLQIIWSILMLGQILTTTIMRCYHVEISNFKHWPDGTLLHLRVSRHFQCPHRVNKLMALFAIDGIYMLTLMPFRDVVSRFSQLPTTTEFTRPVFENIYEDDVIIGRGRHVRCTIQRCLGEKLDETSYQTLHVNNECNCTRYGPMIERVIKILDDGEVPAFVVREQTVDDENRLFIDVVRTGKLPGYVAFSHVWADGLGNKEDNRLPRCQILRLARHARELTRRDPQPFWIDTFGIPRELEQRKKAIAVMNPTYRLAEKVLVLDAGLQQHPSHRNTEATVAHVELDVTGEARAGIALELLLRIACCPWASRLWTLPEGMLGPELYFQFSDGTVELGNLLAQLRLQPTKGTTIVEDIVSILIRLRPKLRTQRRLNLAPMDPFMQNWPQGDLYGQFITMFQALEFRDTTWKEDEATCLAIHLNLDLTKILARDYPERLEALFAQLDQIPSDLIFTHGERIPRYPFRWAPMHLLEYKDNYLCIPAATHERSMGIRTDHGLVVQLNAFMLYTKDEIVPNAQGLYFSVQAETDEGVKYPVNYCMSVAAMDPRTMPSWRMSKTHQFLRAQTAGTERLYVLLGPGHVQGLPADREPGHIGLVAHKIGEEQGCICVAPLDTVVVYKLPGSRIVTPDIINNDNFVHWNGEEMLEDIFCVG